MVSMKASTSYVEIMQTCTQKKNQRNWNLALRFRKNHTAPAVQGLLSSAGLPRGSGPAHVDKWKQANVLVTALLVVTLPQWSITVEFAQGVSITSLSDIVTR